MFATYAVGVIAALLFAGRTSDINGRRPVLAVCAACSALSSVLFNAAQGLPLLFVGRLVSGVSAGLAAASYGVFLAGTAVAGVAAGAAFAGGLSTALSVAGDEERGRVSSLFFLIAYVGLTIPVIAVGIGSTEAGIVPAVITAAAVLTAFDVAALGYLRTRGTRERQPA